MTSAQTNIRDNIIEAALPHVAFDGWGRAVLEQATADAGYPKTMVQKTFPGGVADALAHFSDWTDRQMIEALAHTDIESLRVRDRIRQAVLARLDILQPHKEAVRLALAYWAVPPRGLRATKIIWRTADAIWNWAGDTATDYNRYTKRGLLSGVLSVTTMAWMNDNSSDIQVTKDFLDRRIENVMQLGKLVGKIKKTG